MNKEKLREEWRKEWFDKDYMLFEKPDESIADYWLNIIEKRNRELEKYLTNGLEIGSVHYSRIENKDIELIALPDALKLVNNLMKKDGK